MYKVTPKKYLGQHFLKDKIIAQRIVNTLSARETDTVVEIGPGKGILTQFLLERYPTLWLIEVDPEAANFIRKKFDTSHPRIKLTDILKWEMQEDIPFDSYFIGNLPYYISSPIFFRLLENIEYVREGVFMIQKEVAERICAQKGNKTYGILSVLLGAYFELTYSFSVSPKVFTPPPKVNSGVIYMKRKEILPEVDFKHFKFVVKRAFNQRRKTLKNALKGLEFEDFDQKNRLFTLRAEQLGYEDFILLTRHYQGNI